MGAAFLLSPPGRPLVHGARSIAAWQCHCKQLCPAAYPLGVTDGTSPGYQLGHVGADQGPPVSSLNVELLEAQPQHQLVKDPGCGHCVQAWL